MNLVQYINPNDRKNYQLIYSSQVYGTYFGVYALFVNYAEEDQVEGEDPKEGLKEIIFKVINYKGLLNIGITAINGPKDFLGDAPEKVKIFNIEMQAMHGKEEYTFEWDQVVTLKSEDYIFVKRTLRPIHGEADDRIEVKDGIFDEEFYFREGIYEAATYPDRTPIPDKKMPEIFAANIDFSGRLCPTSINIVTGG